MSGATMLHSPRTKLLFSLLVNSRGPLIHKLTSSEKTVEKSRGLREGGGRRKQNRVFELIREGQCRLLVINGYFAIVDCAQDAFSTRKLARTITLRLVTTIAENACSVRAY